MGMSAVHKEAIGGGSRWVVVCVVLVGVLLAALFYKPIPEGVTESWKARQAVGLLRAIGAVAYFANRVGLGTFVNNTRFLVDNLSLIPPKHYEGIQVEDSYFNGTKVRLYIPQQRGDEDGPGILFVHGGGWLICSVETHDHIVSELAIRLNTMVVSVDYRLCPEHPYPQPLHDSLAALLHFIHNAPNYNVNPRRIAVVGDSAGGNMVAALSLKMKKHFSSLPQPKLQALIYPTLQAVDFQLPSYVQNADAVIGSPEETAMVLLGYMGVDMSHAAELAKNRHTDEEVRETFQGLVHQYLPPGYSASDPAGTPVPSSPRRGRTLAELMKPRLLDPFCFPLMEKNLTGLPQTYIATAEHDPLRDDGFLYAERLHDAGVHVTYYNYPDGFHGILAFFRYPIKMDVGIRMIEDLIAFMKDNL